MFLLLLLLLLLLRESAHKAPFLLQLIWLKRSMQPLVGHAVDDANHAQGFNDRKCKVPRLHEKPLHTTTTTIVLAQKRYCSQHFSVIVAVVVQLLYARGVLPSAFSSNTVNHPGIRSSCGLVNREHLLCLLMLLLKLLLLLLIEQV